MIVPPEIFAADQYYPMSVYVQTDDRSEVEKCLDRSEFADIMSKRLKNEQLTDDDVERLNACAQQSREFEAKIVGGLLMVFLIALAICAVMAVLL